MQDDNRDCTHGGTACKPKSTESDRGRHIEAERSEASTAAIVSPADALAPDLCITGAISSQAQAESRETGGPDTVYIALYGGWTSGKFERVKRRLDDLQAAAQSGDNAKAVAELLPGEHIRMTSAGAKVGFCHYRWVFEWEGCRVYILNREIPSANSPNIWIHFGSLALMRLGFDVLWEATGQFLSLLGFVVEKNLVSRFDACVDLPGVSFGEFHCLWQRNEVITRGTDSAEYAKQRNYTGMSLGGDRVKLRIYDKLLEVQGDLLKHEVLKAKRWLGTPETATRVEFEVNRECLRERWAIDSVADLQAKLPNLVQWLTTEWIRFTDGPVDRENKNHQRAGTAPIWLTVQEAFTAWIGRSAEPISISRRVLDPKIEQLTKQSLGCIKKSLALLGKEVSNSSEFLWQGNKLLRKHSDEFVPKVATTRKELDAAGMGMVCDDDQSPF